MMEMKDLTSLNSISESEFLDMINRELTGALDREKKIEELESKLQNLCANANKLLMCFQMKFIYSSSAEEDSLLTVTDIATMYKKTNKTVLDWIKNKGLTAELVIDDYYVTRKNLKTWIDNKGWRISPAQKSNLFFNEAA
jgi:hypothetical protein